VEIGRTGSREKHRSFDRESPVRGRAFPSKQKGGSYMIKLLVELPLIGKFTIIIVWHRKGSR